MSLIDQTHKQKHLLILKMDECLQLRILKEKDVTDQYVNWMNDYEVVEFTKQQSFTHDQKMVKEFVIDKLNSKNNFLFGIYLNNIHIGNIKLGPINSKNLESDISYFIGEKKLWGKGIASRALMILMHFSFDTLKLKKIHACYHRKAISSGKVLTKCGFKSEVSINGAKDSIYVAIQREDFLLFEKNFL